MIYSSMALPEKEYIQIVPKYYALRSEWIKLSFRERLLSLCYCIAGRRKNFILTGPTACIVLGIAMLDRAEFRPHAICTTHKKSEFIYWHHRTKLPDITTVDGLLVVNAVTAIIDMTLFVTPESLLVSINDCLHNKVFSKEELLAELKRNARIKGCVRLERIIRFATDKCESPLETTAWIAIYKAGFVLPQQQVKISIGQGKSARVDMYWEFGGRKIILELDGRVKYDDGRVLYDEKIREDKLRVMGYEVIRCVWEDVHNGDLIQILANADIPRRRRFGRKFTS